MRQFAKQLLLPVLLFSIFVFSTQSFAAVPTLSPIPRQIIQKNSIGDTVAFQVNDTTVSLDSLFVSVLSSDTLLLPFSNLQLTGQGANRSLIIVPAQNLTGTATIILTVSDKVNSSSDTIAVKVNAPPRLDTDLPLTVAEGATATIGSGLLIAVDPDNSNSQIIFSLGPDSATDLVPQHGVLLLNGTPLHAGSTFTQAQVNLNELSYRNDGTEIDNDFFGISIQDVDGGIASDNGFKIFHFNINVTLYNHPPIAYDTTYAIALGASLHGTLKGTDPDSPVLRFSLVTNATKGSVFVDSVTGNFVFTPNLAPAGVDSFFYQVYDGLLYSVNPGKITLLIAALGPNVSNGSGVVQENKSFVDTLRAVDPNIPPLPIVYTIVNGGHVGNTTLLDSVSGAFQYIPNPNIFGTDTIIFQAHNSQQTSIEGMFIVTIRPALLVDDILFSDMGQGQGSVFLIDFAHHEAASLISGDSVTKPITEVSDPSGNIYVFDKLTGLIEVDPLTGLQTQLAPASSFTNAPLGPRNIAIEHNGMILVADGTAGVKRINPVTKSISVVSSGDSLALAVGIAVDINGNIIVSDLSKLLGGTSKILKIDPVSGHQTVIAEGGNIIAPLALTVDDSVHIFAVDPATFFSAPADLLYKIDETTGIQTLITTSDTLKRPVGIGIMSNGKLIIANGDGSAFIADTATGQSTTLIPPGALKSPGGVYVVKASPLFASSASSLHFPSGGHGSIIKDSILVSNTGSAPLVISNVISDSSEFTISPTSATIAAGGNKLFYITFTPTSGDSISSKITFISNSYNSPSVITVSGAGTITGVKENARQVPRSYALYNNYPNPFNPSTIILFDLPQQSKVSIIVYNILGQELIRLADNKVYEAGTQTVRFDASTVASGIYFYQMRAASISGKTTFTNVKKMLLLR